MWLLALGVLASGWLAGSALVFAHSPAQAVVSVALGLVGLVAGSLAPLRPSLRAVVGWTGALSGLSAFVLWDSFAVTASHIAVAIPLVIAGFFPEARVVTPGVAAATATAPAPQPARPEVRLPQARPLPTAA